MGLAGAMWGARVRAGGPFVDKDGVEWTRFDATLDRYGASIQLAGEGRHPLIGDTLDVEDSER